MTTVPVTAPATAAVAEAAAVVMAAMTAQEEAMLVVSGWYVGVGRGCTEICPIQ